MTLLSGLSLLAIMFALAALPSTSVALVVTRSATAGLGNGVAVAVGIILGDLVFVTLAILGVSTLAASMGAAFGVLKYLGGTYLVWLGAGLLRSRGELEIGKTEPRPSALLASLASGFIVTLGDIKALLFYASLFPAFVDMASLTGIEITAVAGITVLAVGGVKVTYAFAARRIVARLRKGRAGRGVGIAGGAIMVGAGTYLIAKA